MTVLSDEQTQRHMVAALDQVNCSFEELGVAPAQVLTFDYQPQGRWTSTHVTLDLVDGRRLHVEPLIPSGYRVATEWIVEQR